MSHLAPLIHSLLIPYSCSSLSISLSWISHALCHFNYHLYMDDSQIFICNSGLSPKIQLHILIYHLLLGFPAGYANTALVTCQLSSRPYMFLFLISSRDDLEWLSGPLQAFSLLKGPQITGMNLQCSSTLSDLSLGSNWLIQEYLLDLQ